MRRSFVAAAILTAFVLGALGGGATAQELPEPPNGFKPPPPPPPAPIKPFTSVTIKLAGPYSDPSFVAFRKALGDAAQHKDRAALAKLVVAHGFFWIQDKNLADDSKPGIENLAKAIALDDPSGAGWAILAGDASDQTLAELPQDKGVFCAPAPPTFDVDAFETMVQQTDTDPTDWGYPVAEGVALRVAPQPNATEVQKLGLYFIRVLQDTKPANPGEPQFLHVALPDGKSGFVPIEAILPLTTDQICYSKEADGWKIAGYVGGVSP